MMTSREIPIEEIRETIEDSVEVVLDHCGCWPSDEPTKDDGIPAIAAWHYVTGWANGKGLTAEELIRQLNIPLEHRTGTA